NLRWQNLKRHVLTLQKGVWRIVAASHSLANRNNPKKLVRALEFCPHKTRQACRYRPILSHSITRKACRPCFIEGTGTLKSSKKGIGSFYVQLSSLGKRESETNSKVLF